MRRRGFLRVLGGAAAGALVLPRVPQITLPTDRQRQYFFGGWFQDDTARLQAFLDKGGGSVPQEWGQLIVRGPIHLRQDGAVLANAVIHAKGPNGLEINGTGMVKDCDIQFDGKYGLYVPWGSSNLLVWRNRVSSSGIAPPT